MGEFHEPSGLSFEIVSAPDRDDLYAELTLDGVQWGEMCEVPGRDDLLLKVYFVTPDGSDGRKVLRIDFDVDPLIDLLRRARQRLLRMRPGGNEPR